MTTAERLYAAYQTKTAPHGTFKPFDKQHKSVQFIYELRAIAFHGEFRQIPLLAKRLYVSFWAGMDVPDFKWMAVPTWEAASPHTRRLWWEIAEEFRLLGAIHHPTGEVEAA